MLNRKAMVILLTAGLIDEIQYKMSKYFPKPRAFGGNVKVELYLYNYVTKTDLKNAAGADTSKFAKKVDLASLKSIIEKTDIGKLETNSVDLKK